MHPCAPFYRSFGIRIGGVPAVLLALFFDCRYRQGARGASRGAADDACEQARPARGNLDGGHFCSVRHAQNHKSGVSITTMQRAYMVSTFRAA